LLDAVLAREPANAAALRERGTAAEAEREPDADGWYRRAVECDPSDKEACYRLGRYLLGRGWKDEARPWLDRHAAIERDLTRLRELHAHVTRTPGDAEARCEAGLICLRNGQREEGRRWLLGALRVNPRHAGARQALAGLDFPPERP
jgi:thioredoxin-like negative regulator of GroEL